MDATTLLDEYTSGRRDFRHAQLEGAALDRAVLPAIDLTGANLQGASLMGANLRNGRLDGADLSGAELAAAGLRGANLQRAILRQAALTGARLQGADLRRADLSRADLVIADFQGASLAGAELAEATLSDAKLACQDLTSLNLRGAVLHTADLRGANLSDSDLTGANLSDSDLTGPNLAGPNLAGPNLRKANLNGARLTRARLVGANLTDAKLRNADMTRSDLSGADLCGVDLTGALLDDANLQDAVRPTVEEDRAVRELLGVEPAVIRQCRDLEAWLGSHYELALNYSPQTLDQDARLRLLRVLWGNPRLVGLVSSRGEFGQAWQQPDVADTERGHHRLGCIRLTPDRVLGCGSLFIDLDTLLQFVVYISSGMLDEVYRVGYPIVRHGNPWIREVDEVLAEIARVLFVAAPFGLGLMGEESASWWVTQPTPAMLAGEPALLVPEEHSTRLGVPLRGSRSPEGLWWTGGASS
jgi:uncharacterized protein YjbI with pentapeptide repeats